MVTAEGIVVGFLIAWILYPVALIVGVYAFDTENDDHEDPTEHP